MSDKGQGDAGTVATFDHLDLEGQNKDKDEYPEKKKMDDLLKYLKEKLAPQQFTEVAKILGLKSEATMEMVLAAINELSSQLAKKKPEKPEEYPTCEEDLAKKGYPYPYKGKGSEKDLLSYTDFMAKCMKGGKSMKECADDYKKENPEPKKEAAPTQDLAAKEPTAEIKKLSDQVTALEAEINTMKEQRRMSGIASKVDKLVEGKNLAPAQREATIKLMAKMPENLHEEYLDSFRSQKFRGFEDIGQTKTEKPGAPEKLSAEESERLRKEYGIAQMAKDKGFKGVA